MCRFVVILPSVDGHSSGEIDFCTFLRSEAEERASVMRAG